MRHRKGNKKLNLPTDQRLAMLKNMVISLFKSGKIQTTHVRAKQAARLAETLITLGKKGSIHARRQALKVIPHKPTIQELFATIAPSLKERKGGYTRLTRVSLWRGDGAVKSLLEIV